MPLPPIPPGWADALAGAVADPSYAELSRFLDEERGGAVPVYPPEDQVFAALKATPLAKVKLVIVGQDPYHQPGQAHGLCFSVPPGVKKPPSLRNLLRELEADLGVASPEHGDLTVWAERGVLLLNTVLTVRDSTPGAHAGKGWEAFTDAVLGAVVARRTPAVFLLLGGFAKKKAELVTPKRHRVIEAAHPSPLSARHFLGSRPFSRVEAALAQLGRPRLDFRFPDGPQRDD